VKRRKRQEVEGLAREMRAERLVRRREASYRNWSQRRGWSPPAEPAFTDAAGSVTPSQPPRDEAYDRMERMLVDPPDERAAELIGMLRSSGRRSDQRRADLFERIRR
jgi:hypothetical protein